ncbi:type II secretion system protein GspL [Rhizorhabdus argentea]|uniref:type II secretion system protein GspL n=1 Tax=Rhizorhabdus argentea TaxID=1387174 RepID=UPI0030EECFE5
MRALLLFAEEEVGTVEGWFRLVDGRVVARGSGIDSLPLREEGERLFLLLAGSEVTMRWLTLPMLTEAQALAAARLAIADDSLGPIDALHVVLGRIHGGHRLVAVIAHERIGAWLDWAASVAIDPDHVVPLPLLIAYGEGPARVWARPRRTLVHGALQAFAIETELAEMLLGDTPVETMDDARFEAELPVALLALPLDLRQGAWRRRRVWRVDGEWRRRMLRYAVAAAILLALIPVARLGRLAWEAHRLHSEAGRVAQSTLGTPTRPEDPRAVLLQRLERLQGPGMGFVDGSAALFGAVRQTPNVELADLAFGDDGTLTADVRSASAADLAELVRRIGSSGLVVETSGNGQGISSVRIRQP